MWKHFKVNSEKGQSIIELGIFGAILIFCLSVLITYGMSANYQQRMEMRAFRLALSKAAKNGEPEDWDYNRKNPPNAPQNAQMTFINDKPVPNPANMFGIDKPLPFIASASAAWSPFLSFEANSDLDTQKMDIVVNQEPQPHTYTLAKYKTDIACSGGVWFKAIDYPKVGGDGKIIPGSDKYDVTGRLINPGEIENKGDGIYWYWKYESCNRVITPDDIVDADGKEMKEKDPDNIDPEDGFVASGSMADVDSDGKEEQIMDVVPEKTETVCNKTEDRVCQSWDIKDCVIYQPPTGEGRQCVKFKAKAFHITDLQEGDIDMTIDSADIAGGKKKQGLINDSQTEVVRRERNIWGHMRNELIKTESSTQISTTSTPRVTTRITRKVRRNKDAQHNQPYEEDITSVVQEGGTTTWTTSLNP